jgi:phenylpyruvate tautomerase PptA (4-oxalocrotonate tautomerase family)
MAVAQHTIPAQELAELADLLGVVVTETVQEQPTATVVVVELDHRDNQAIVEEAAVAAMACIFQ